MRLTKRQLKRIIREEYSRLKRRGLIKEGYEESFEPLENFGSTYSGMGSAVGSGMGQSCINLAPKELMMMVCEICEANPEKCEVCCDLVVSAMAKDSVGCEECMQVICECPMCEEICLSYCGA